MTEAIDVTDIIDQWAPAAAAMLDLFAAFQQQRNLSPLYIADARWTLKRLALAVPVALEDATEEHLRQWYAPLVFTLSPESRGVYLGHVSAFYGWLVRERIRDDDPTTRLPRPKNKRPMPRPMSAESLTRALATAQTPVREFLLLAAYAGLRAAEIAGLHAEDVHRSAEPPIVLVRDAKGGRQRIVPLHPALVDALCDRPSSGPLFVNRWGDPFTPTSVSARVSRFLRGLGITETLHQGRHFFATNIYRGCLDLRMTQELLGHSDPKTTARYAAWAPERAASVVCGLPTL